MTNVQKILMTLLIPGIFNSCNSGAKYVTPKVAHGSIVSYPDFKSNYIPNRTVEVWLPENYSSDQKHAVLYMHDGQNLFDPSLSYIGVEWGMDETTQKLIDEEKIKPTIIVGIYNTENRYLEYIPQDPFMDGRNLSSEVKNLQGTPVSNDYLNFLTQELKPFIDKNFSTLTDAPNTIIGGSSMGGLISLYALLKYPNIFGAGACISTHWPMGNEQAVDLAETHMTWLGENLDQARGQRFYFDFGTETLDEQYEPYQIRATNIFLDKGYIHEEDLFVRKFEGDEHSERAWSKRIHIPLELLLGIEKN